MQVDDGASDHSSSSISSPPTSPPRNHHHDFSDTIRVNPRPPFSNPGLSGGGVANGNSATSVQLANVAHTLNGNTSTQAKPNSNPNGTAPEKPKRQRKKKEVPLGPDGKPIVDDKPKKQRKPRPPKDPNAVANGDKPAAPRKKQKTEPKAAPHDASVQSRQPTITETFGAFHTPTQPASTAVPPQPRISDSMTRTNLPPPSSKPSTPRPASSGQNYYDPIRGATIEAPPPRVSTATNGAPPPHGSPHVNRASASPAIAGLIDPPNIMKKHTLPSVYSPPTVKQQPFVPSQPQSPSAPKQAAFAAPLLPQASPPVTVTRPMAVSNLDGAMDVEPICELPKQQVPEIKAPSKSSSSAPTPKAARPTPPPAPKGTGSGLLSSSDLFGGPSTSEPSGRKGVNIDIQIPLNPRGGNTINIAQEIVKKYGRDAINPRAAAHRDQLLRIAAEANRLENGSNDDMSVDLMSELEGDSNVEMGGMDDEKSNTGADGEKPRKRRKKIEEYDKEDDFIDDTELAWQEQAAVAKDGFFVYSGPLIPEGQQPQIESSTSTRGTRGGRGRGRGSRTATSGTTHASLKEKTTSDPNSTSSTRGRARSTRGTGATRKPRITKADRERMEAEKADRERAAQGMSGPPGASVALAPTPTPAPQQQPQQQSAPLAQQSYAQQPMGTTA